MNGCKQLTVSSEQLAVISEQLPVSRVGDITLYVLYR
jgi:hypothetical protein